MEDKKEVINSHTSSLSNQCINCKKPSDSRIKHSHPFYCCKEHPKFENIYLEVIESHIILAKDHKYENRLEDSVNSAFGEG
jgi:hypothetical protein